MYGINNRDKNSNFPLQQNKKKNEYYYDFGTQKAIKIPPKEKDPFVEGFNSTQSEVASQKQESPTTQYGKTKTTTPQSSYIGGDIKTDEDKGLFMTGFREETAKKQNPDALEFGEDSETYKILQDLGSRWHEADPTEQARLHGVAEKVRRLARNGDSVVDKTEEIMGTMHKNAETAKEYQNRMIEQIQAYPYLATNSSPFLDSALYLIKMVNRGPWDYKYDENWRVPMVNGKTTFDGYDLTQDNYRNYLEWMYFDGYLLGADKVGNMNMAYVGKKMGLPEWVYKNWWTTDKDDAEWVERGIGLAESGRQ